jgi:hypothetical protein
LRKGECVGRAVMPGNDMCRCCDECR